MVSLGFRGVTARYNKWQARLRYGGKRHSVGTFDTQQEAAAAYDTAARQHIGAGAVCNFATAEEGAAAAAAAAAANASAPKPKTESSASGG
jgi:hypothetical protein